MSIQVKCFNEKKAKAELKKCPKIVQDYLKLLSDSNERWKYINDQAIKKIKEQAKIISSTNSIEALFPSDEEVEICAKADTQSRMFQLFFKRGADFMKKEIKNKVTNIKQK